MRAVLVDGGRAVPGLNDTRSARRTLILTGGPIAPRRFLFERDPAELGNILGTPATVPISKCRRALNPMADRPRIWFAGGKRPFSIREQKTVRNLWW